MLKLKYPHSIPKCLSFKKAIEMWAACGCDGVTITGVLGESNRLLDS
eukprot:SAG31_NODE_41422_length_276_cov_0.587571_1_plen_46_part_01